MLKTVAGLMDIVNTSGLLDDFEKVCAWLLLLPLHMSSSSVLLLPHSLNTFRIFSISSTSSEYLHHLAYMSHLFRRLALEL